MKKVQCFVVVSVLILVVALVGCSNEDGGVTNSAPTVFAVAPSGAEDMLNFGVANSSSSTEGTNWTESSDPPYTIGDETWWGASWRGDVYPPWFWVTIHSAGDHVISYGTWYGFFSVKFRTSEDDVSVAIFLNERDNFSVVEIHKGTITSGDVVYEEGNVQVFGQLPYSSMMAVPEGFTTSSSMTLLDYGMYNGPNPAVALCTRSIEKDCGDDYTGYRGPYSSCTYQSKCWPFGSPGPGKLDD